MKNCPICQSGLSMRFFDGGRKPLATLGWPTTKNAAINMERFALDYRQCLRCSHIWNSEFNYRSIPYEDNPNRMFNEGSVWQAYIKKTLTRLNEFLPKNPTVIDIGCGEGHFVRDLAKCHDNSGKFIGFDPNTSSESGAGIDFIPKYFEPQHDIKRYQPDVLIMRHVLEHLEHPTEFMEQLAFSASSLDKPIFFFAETPCVDLAIKSKRIVDFFYEHPSQFTKSSFTKLMKMGGEVSWIETDYGDEVINGLVRLSIGNGALRLHQQAQKFSRSANKSKEFIVSQLQNLIQKNYQIVIWGGTGKAATFIQHYDLCAKKYPNVVDSDQSKVGTYVPGMGQEIKHASELDKTNTDIIIIPTQWRATDIYNEIKSREITYKQIILEFDGKLIDYEKDAHPYKSD